MRSLVELCTVVIVAAGATGLFIAILGWLFFA